MKFKLLLLLLLLLSSGLMRAQQPYTNLIFSEVRMDQWHHSYVEICNMGNVAVDLAQFELGSLSPWDAPFTPGTNGSVRLPARMLNPGETFVVATVRDWVLEQSIINPERYGPLTKDDMWREADMQIHVSESPNNDPTDSVSVGSGALSCWGGYHCFYLRHHYTATDSVVTDAVNGIFTGTDNHRPSTVASDVAGVTNATSNSILVRKYSVKTGTGEALDSWDHSRGVDLTDSEWLPIPILLAGGYEAGRKEFWTVGNHGNFRLNAQTLKSSTVAIDWNANTMSVDWGARQLDSIMNEFDKVPGIGWHYYLSPNKLDSAYTSVRTGDSLVLYACGNQLDKIAFKLIALPPSNTECRIIPKNAKNGTGGWYTPYVVTEGAALDTIRGGRVLGIPFDTRVDTLLKYMEKPDAATWQVIWVDGVERPDLKMGDKLKVTAANGSSTKEYYIKVANYLPSHDANLASITWPDIPDYYRGIYGWMGDTIPNFTPTKFNYKVQIPFDVPGIPAFVVKPENTDAKIAVTRAATLAGSIEDRTIKYVVTAEDDTTINTYSIELDKEKDLTNVQPYNAEPFFSQFVFRADWRQNFIEICNPGNQPLDLSHYCVLRTAAATIPDAFTSYTQTTDWANRYYRYVPGYVWQDETNWTVQPAMLEQDFSVNTIVESGDVFVLAWAYPKYKDVSSRDYPDFAQIDVNFKNTYNPWGITFAESADGLANYQNVCGGWFTDSWLLFKITNDSVFSGLKPLTDPNDVEIVDVIGRLGGNAFGTMYTANAAGVVRNITFNQNSGLKRLPQFHKGNVNPGESFGDSASARISEWRYTTDAYWTSKGYGWPLINSMNSDGIGSHELNTITEFISTVSSTNYIVSKGYSQNESIIGPAPGITVDEFLLKIIKNDAGQTLTLKHGATIITGSEVLSNGDVLTVVSADGKNTTKYIITVAADALDNNALLTSTKYAISVSGNTGTVGGFAPGTSLKTVYEGVTAPATASLFTIYNADGTYASFKQINFDTVYVDVVATDQVFFEVTAQNGVTKITYQLQPTSTSADAYVLSNVYDIDQTGALIKLIPDGINVQSFFNSLIPAPGATMELQNNMGQVRAMGTIYVDDKLVVTAQNGTTKKTYLLKMLSETAQERRAFAFSDIYTVSQAALSIKLPFGTTVSAATFISNIYVSFGATFVLQNADGTTKSSGDIVAGDLIVVTSNDGSVVRTYLISFMVSSTVIKQGNIKMYPNPTSGDLRITGIQSGNIITIYNTAGHRIHSFKASSSFEMTSLQQQPAGMYFIIIDNGAQVIGRFKVIKN